VFARPFIQKPKPETRGKQLILMMVFSGLEDGCEKNKKKVQIRDVIRSVFVALPITSADLSNERNRKLRWHL
jgi:hypothetical protein